MILLVKNKCQNKNYFYDTQTINQIHQKNRCYTQTLSTTQLVIMLCTNYNLQRVGPFGNERMEHA
jgi:hypothetical protein